MRETTLLTLITACFFFSLCPFAHAWNNYKSDGYSDGYYQSWDKYKIDNQIKVETQPTFWQNVGKWISSAISATYNFIKTAVTGTYNFIKDVAPKIKDFFIKEKDFQSPDISTTKETFKTSDIEKQPTQELNQADTTATAEQQQETEATQINQDYSSVTAGAYKTNIEIDDYTLRPDGARENDIAFNKLPENIKAMVPVFENAVARIQNKENMVMVLLQTTAKIQDITLKGEQIRTLLCKINEGLLNYKEVDLLKNVNTITKQGNDLIINLNQTTAIKYSHPDLFEGSKIKIKIPELLKISATKMQNSVSYDFGKKTVQAGVLLLWGSINGLRVDENNTVYLKYKLYNAINKENKIYSGVKNGNN